jgi:VWFA-related protein
MVLRANAFAVLVDVVVTDQGKAVHGIDPKRFHVYDNGKEQAITFLDEHRPDQLLPQRKHPTLPPHTYNNLPPHSPSSAVNVLLLDGLNTPLSNQVEVHKQMVEYIKTIEPGTTMAIFTLASRLRMVQGFTSNVGDLTKALESEKTAPKQSVALSSDSGDAFKSAISNLAMMNAPTQVMNSIQAFQADASAIQSDRRVQVTMEAMQQLARYLSAVPGRKNLVWFSASFPIVLGPDSSQNPLRNSRSYADQVQITSEMLSAARVAVYPVDARGVMSLPGFGVSDGGLGSKAGADGTPAFAMQNNEAMDNAASEHFTMEQLAQMTGGMAFFNTNGLKAAVASAIDNGASYYTIGYVPASKDFNGDFRKVKVKIDNSKFELAYRRGYYADPPGKRSSHGLVSDSLMTTATLHGAPPSTQILFQTRVLPADDPIFKDARLPDGLAGELTSSLKGKTQRYIVDMAVDPHTLTFDTKPGEVREATIEFTLVAYDSEGRRVNFFDRATRFSLAPDQYDHVMTSGIPIRMALDLPAGEGSLRIAVHDIDGVRVGSIELPILVPAD